MHITAGDKAEEKQMTMTSRGMFFKSSLISYVQKETSYFNPAHLSGTVINVEQSGKIHHTLSLLTSSSVEGATLTLHSLKNTLHILPRFLK